MDLSTTRLKVPVNDKTRSSHAIVLAIRETTANRTLTVVNWSRIAMKFLDA